MAFVPATPSTQTSAFPPPLPMRAISWQINPITGFYDIFNSFTPAGNEGNLLVIKSKILIVLSTFQGEWQADPTFGIPFNSVTQNSDNPDVLGQIIVTQILTVQNVLNVIINNFSYSPTTRIFTANFTVNTVYGTTTIQMG
jgi:hypothetical protein